MKLPNPTETVQGGEASLDLNMEGGQITSLTFEQIVMPEMKYQLSCPSADGLLLPE